MPQDAINTYYIFDQTRQRTAIYGGGSDKLYLIGNPFSATWRERKLIWDTMRRGNIVVKNAVANSNGTITITNKSYSELYRYMLLVLDMYKNLDRYKQFNASIDRVKSQAVKIEPTVNVLNILYELTNQYRSYSETSKRTVGKIEVQQHILKMMKIYLQYVKDTKCKSINLLKIIPANLQSKKSVIIDPNTNFTSAIRNSVDNLNNLSNINLQADALMQDIQKLNTVINILLDLTNKSDIDFQNSIQIEKAAVSILYAMANGMRYNALAQEMINRYIVDLQIDYGNYIEATLKNQNPQLTMKVLDDRERSFKIDSILQFFKKDYDEYNAWIIRNKNRINKICDEYQQQVTGLIDAFSELHKQCKNYKSILNSNYKSAERWLRYARVVDETKSVHEQSDALLLLDNIVNSSSKTFTGIMTDFGVSLLNKKRARAKEVLDRDAVKLIEKYQNEITQADADVIHYIYDYMSLVAIWNKNKNPFKNNKTRAEVENQMSSQYTVIRHTYLSILLQIQILYDMSRDIDIQTGMCGLETFITIWIAAYLCYQNNIDHSQIKAQRDLDILFWLIVQDLAVDRTYRGKNDKSKNICFYESIKQMSNNIYYTNFRNKKETKHSIDVSRYIIESQSGQNN